MYTDMAEYVERFGRRAGCKRECHRRAASAQKSVYVLRRSTKLHDYPHVSCTHVSVLSVAVSVSVFVSVSVSLSVFHN